MPSPARPNPDQLLAEVQQHEARQRRGKLKVFFGMSAGVGKTYAMLEEARKRTAEGANVVVGYAEPHIRPETEALLLGMEILPYKIVEYKGAQLKEFDLDAALTRAPEILCVDELAHTNAPGLRHPKRWQDVVELLDAGINVYTTLNVQHLESVNDIVARITGVTVRETLPDSVLEESDEVELVDIAPEELLERFQEGKVYRPDLARQAQRHFFSKGNLIALRELALRTTAQRVDAQMLEARNEVGAEYAWPASERVLVCVGPSPMSRRLVRSARRLAAGLRADWIAAYVETPSSAQQSAADRHRIEGTLKLADELGGKTVTLTSHHVADEIIAYARRHNVTKIVIGKPQRARWKEALFGSVVDDLIRRSGDIDIHVIRDGPPDPDTPDASPPSRTQTDKRGYLAAALVTAVAVLVGWPLYHGWQMPAVDRAPRFSNINVLMLFLLGVLWIATRYSKSAAILCSVLSVAAFDFVFVPPYLTFTVSDQQYLLTFIVMLLTALTISTLTHRVRGQAQSAGRDREQRTAALFALSRELARAATTEQIAASTVRHVHEVLGGRAVLLLSDSKQQLALIGDSQGSGDLAPKELGVAQWARDHDQPAGRGTNTLPAADGTYLPLRASRDVVGVLGLLGSGEAGLSAEQRQLADAFASQAALAVERATLADEARLAVERAEAEVVRNTLLSGVSHDLRTPLAAITGSASTLIETGDQLNASARAEMLDTIHSEAERMERLISNLLEMTRLESGGPIIRKDWQSLQDVIGSALAHVRRRAGERQISVDLPKDLPLVQIDAVALEQVFVNLIDNALEHGPSATAIDVCARVHDGNMIVEVLDRGPGLPPGAEKRVFEKFFRSHAPGQSRRGIGLGLAICRAVVEAHGGSISAENRDGGGACFRIEIPLGGKAPDIDSSA